MDDGTIPKHPPTVRVKTRIPFYRPGGLPMNWRDEQTGILPAAVKAYLDYQCEKDAKEPTPEQLDLLIDFLRHYICAPCWNGPAREARDAGDNSIAATLIQLRLDICEGRVKTVQEIDQWIHRCLEICLDPI